MLTIKLTLHSLTHFKVEEDKVNEFDVWHGLANLYASLSHWKDAEICLQKARELKHYSAATLHTEGKLTTFIFIGFPFCVWHGLAKLSSSFFFLWCRHSSKPLRDKINPFWFGGVVNTIHVLLL